MRTRTSGVTVREKARQALKADLDLAKLELDRNQDAVRHAAWSTSASSRRRRPR